MSPPLAVITGATSGIGLSLVRHLHAKGWRVVLADIDLSKIADLEKEFGSSAMFQQTDVSDWDSQVVLFKKAREWGGGRIDFLAANAGVTDTFGLYRLAEDIEPQKPQLDTITVNLVGVLYSVYLFKHWASKHHEKGGKIVITSSVAGVYASLASPIYSASKHAVSLL
jgi:15-hydroxyprostaglandin dehydrogenase (NAD)